MALIGYTEFVKMSGVRLFEGIALLGYATISFFLFPWPILHTAPMLTLLQTVWLSMILALVANVATSNRVSIHLSSLLWFASLYIGFGFYYMMKSRHMPHGLYWTCLLLACIWATDIGAYFIGKLWGRRKLWPTISPNKTVEGALGGIVISLVTAVSFSVLESHLLAMHQAIIIGLVCSVVGQIGDFIQSAYKRVFQVKDTGALFPGHGGLLDRCDSWIVVFPFVHLFII